MADPAEPSGVMCRGGADARPGVRNGVALGLTPASGHKSVDFCRLIETSRELHHPPGLDLHWADHPEDRVAATSAVDPFDQIVDSNSRVLPCWRQDPVIELAFQNGWKDSNVGRSDSDQSKGDSAERLSFDMDIAPVKTEPRSQTIGLDARA